MHPAPLCLLLSLVPVLGGFSSRPVLQPSRSGLALSRLRVVLATASLEPGLDLVGDGGVLKTVVEAGTGARPQKGATVEVHYEGTLADTGAIFDSSRKRNKTFKFVLGEGKVIGGWEVGLASMQAGEKATLVCGPQYAYGEKGIPPLIPPSSTLQFEVELLSVQAPAGEKKNFADDNPLAPRTPGTISQAYADKMANKPLAREGLDGLIDKVKSWYIFGLFSNSPEERPPWYLNPLITFPAIFVIVGLGFTLVVELGGLHRGEAPVSGDDLSAFLGETLPAE